MSTSVISDESESVIQPGVRAFALPSPLEGRLTTIQRVVGGYNDVYLGVWTRPDGEPLRVALKYLRKAYIASDDEDKVLDRMERRVRREVIVWQAANHENILPFLGYQILDGDPVLVSPWCENGNLRQYTQKHIELSEVKKLALLCDAARGLAYLHSLAPPVVHGDISPDNVLITDVIRAVLCDFGISRVMTELAIHTGLTTDNNARGAVGYLAKELYEDNSPPTPCSDVYAYGGVILATMSGRAPFYKKVPSIAVVLAIHMNQTASPSDHPKLPESDPLWGLLRRCWDPDPEQRPSINEVYAELMAEVDSRSN